MATAFGPAVTGAMVFFIASVVGWSDIGWARDALKAFVPVVGVVVIVNGLIPQLFLYARLRLHGSSA